MNKQRGALYRNASCIAGIAAMLFATSYVSSLYANPTGAQIVSGTVSVNPPAAGQMTITQKTPKAIVNWNSFSIGANESVNIVQPSATAALLNRVVGNDASVIAGRLQANGNVILVNPAGVIFAQGSSVNVGSMIASTLNIADADFLAGNYHFMQASAAPLSNAGALNAQSGGTIALLGGSVSNTGTVTARLGTVALGAGNDITVDFAGDGLTMLKINQGAANALLGNTGTLAADGGAVIMSAQAADALAGTVINQQGIVRAQSLSERNGHILLDGGTNGVTQLSGTLDATGGAALAGGRIDVTGYDVALLAGAHVDASGATGGGAVRFGGGAGGADPGIRNANAIWMAPTATIHADALVNGSGGNVVAYSNAASRIYGTLSATGGAQGGNGGLIETSGHYLDTSGAKIDASAPHGKGGTWKLDPANIDIVSAASGTQATETPGSGGSPTVFTPVANTDSQVVNTLIDSALNSGTSVTVTTVGSSGTSPGNINILAPITANPIGTPTLTLSALGSISDSGQSITSTSGPFNLVLEANVGATSAGFSPVQITNGANLATNGGFLSISGNGPVDIENSTLSTLNGNVTISGLLAQSTGVTIGGSTITTTSGNVTISGQGTFGDGVDLGNSFITTSSGNITIAGTSLSSSEGSTFGVSIFNDLGTGPRITTSSGSVLISGQASGGSSIGVRLSNASIGTSSNTSANGAGSVTIAGSANDGGTGLGGAVGVSLSGGSGITTNNSPVTISGAATNGRAIGVALTGLSSIATVGGNITVAGSVSSSPAFGFGINIDGSSITSSSGSLHLSGQSTGTLSPALTVDGIELHNSLGIQGTPATVTTGSGALDIWGSGSGPNAQGVLIADGSSIVTTQGGPIDIRGAVVGPAGSSPNLDFDYGVLVLNGTIQAMAPGSTIAISGSTSTSDAGVALGAVPLSSGFGFSPGTVAITAAGPGSIVLRAANDGTASSLLSRSATLSSPNGVLTAMPASVDPSTFSITPLNATPITLLESGAGLAIDPLTFQTFSTTLQTLVLGSSTQTGLITVNGQCSGSSTVCVLTRPTFTTNLTLSNPGAGSQGIQLPFGVSLPGKTLTLASAGPVTDPGGIQAAGLLLAGPGTFTLTDPQNAVGVLAMVGAGNVNFLNSTGFVIGPIVSQTYDPATNQLTTIDGTNSTLTGNLFAQAATGGIGLGGGTASAGGPTGGANTNLSAGGSIDLVMENGVFTNAGTGSLSAGGAWRVWALTWNGETRGNVQPNTAQPNFYGCTFGAGCVWGGVVPGTGNHFVYVDRPTLTVTANDALRFALTSNPPFSFTVLGLINGDTAAGALSGTLTTPATLFSPAGRYAIDPVFASGVGYLVNEIPGTLTVLPVPDSRLPLAVSGLQSFFGNAEQTFVYENNLQGTNICIGSSQPLFTGTPPGDAQDILAVEWKRVRSQPNLNSCLLVNSQHGCGDF